MEKLTLRQVRGMRGLTQVEVSEATGLDPMTISRIEKGSDAMFSTIQRLCAFYRVSMDDIIMPDLVKTQHLNFTHVVMSDS